MKIYEAAKVVLESAEKPLHAKEIYQEILRRELYKFGAKNPVSVLTQAMSERSVGNTKNKEEVFSKVSPGIFQIAPKS